MFVNNRDAFQPVFNVQGSGAAVGIAEAEVALQASGHSWYGGILFQVEVLVLDRTDETISGLQAFSTRPDFAILDYLEHYRCQCRDEWNRVIIEEEVNLPERLLVYYETTARNKLRDAWWQQSKDTVLRVLERSDLLRTSSAAKSQGIALEVNPCENQPQWLLDS